MTPYYEDDHVTIIHGDCRDVLPSLGTARFGISVTSPPYNMGLTPGGNGRGLLDIGLAIADNRVVTDLASSLIAFQVGSTYEARSACDYDCVWTFTVVSRTSRFITITDRNGEVRRVGVRVWQGVESASPLGTYSMAPVLRAERQAVAA